MSHDSSRSETDQGPSAVGYILTEEEKRVWRECQQESLWQRSLPFSALSMAVTKVLISKGVVRSTGRYGSVSKVAVMGLLGLIAGKMSYMSVCQEKFKNLENSPVGEAFRLAQQKHTNRASQSQSGLEDDGQPPSQPGQPGPSQSYADFSYSDSAYQPTISSVNPDSALSESVPSWADDDISLPAPSYLEEEKPKKKSIFYKDLRNKNRENYEVTMTQKAGVLLKPAPDRAQPSQEVKKNIYGDSWEE
ncbi:hypothetical protein COCON_G00071300 [Conger conger]|uniref:OCIA domain-containing protein 1 n=1 Tax=Conger conger TaxID=82655 RepID=A0A9Q1DTU1_CONCO|nr:hypothetical protein COCON_G00071300 [Conger conger]